MFYLGDHAPGAVIPFPFDAYDNAGASVTITGLAVTDIEVYKNGSTTQRSSDNGYTLLDTDGIDFDGTTGLHGFSIDTGNNSDAGFWAAGNYYWVNVNSITVDGQTVRFTYFFTLGMLLRPTTAGRTLDVSATGEADANITQVGGGNIQTPDGTGVLKVQLAAGLIHGGLNTVLQLNSANTPALSIVGLETNAVYVSGNNPSGFDVVKIEEISGLGGSVISLAANVSSALSLISTGANPALLVTNTGVENGQGVVASSSSGNGLQIIGGEGPGALIQGNSIGLALVGVGDCGLSASGPTGMKSLGSTEIGFSASGPNAGILGLGNSGHGIVGEGFGGNGALFFAATGNNNGVQASGAGTGSGFSGLGSGTGSGFNGVGGVSGHGMRLTRGGAAGDDFNLANSDAPNLITAIWSNVVRTLTASTNLETAAIQNLLEADVRIDKATTPWSMKFYLKGTSTLLLTKQLYDVDGGNIGDTDTVLGRAMQ